MNTCNFKKSISCLFKLGFIALAILGLSFAAQAGSIGVVSSAQLSSSSSLSDLSLSEQQDKTLQSTQPQLPSCSNSSELDFASSTGTIQQISPANACACCDETGAPLCCIGCTSRQIDIDAS